MTKKRIKYNYEKEIFSNFFEKRINLVIFSIIFIIVLLYWNFVLKQYFNWKNVDIFSKPKDYAFYSLLTFSTLGAWLYKVGFYKWLYSLFGSGKDFKKTKAEIWILLVVIVVYIVSLVVDMLNFIASVFYNAGVFIFYLLPSITTTLILIIIFTLIKKKYAYFRGNTTKHY